MHEPSRAYTYRDIPTPCTCPCTTAVQRRRAGLPGVVYVYTCPRHHGADAREAVDVDEDNQRPRGVIVSLSRLTTPDRPTRADAREGAMRQRPHETNAP